MKRRDRVPTSELAIHSSPETGESELDPALEALTSAIRTEVVSCPAAQDQGLLQLARMVQSLEHLQRAIHADLGQKIAALAKDVNEIKDIYTASRFDDRQIAKAIKDSITYESTSPSLPLILAVLYGRVTIPCLKLTDPLVLTETAISSNPFVARKRDVDALVAGLSEVRSQAQVAVQKQVSGKVSVHFQMQNATNAIFREKKYWGMCFMDFSNNYVLLPQRSLRYRKSHRKRL